MYVRESTLASVNLRLMTDVDGAMLESNEMKFNAGSRMVMHSSTLSRIFYQGTENIKVTPPVFRNSIICFSGLKSSVGATEQMLS